MGLVNRRYDYQIAPVRGRSKRYVDSMRGGPAAKGAKGEESEKAEDEQNRSYLEHPGKEVTERGPPSGAAHAEPEVDVAPHVLCLRS